MTKFPFFFTWSSQNHASFFPVDRVDNTFIYSKTNTGETKELIDMSSISYQASFGQNHPTIIKHIQKQLTQIPLAAPKAIFPGKVETTQNLLKYLGRDLNNNPGKIFYTTSGAESVENALKIARQITGKKIVLAREISYHGATLGALGATGDWRNKAHVLPENWVVRIPEPHAPDAILETKKIIQHYKKENIAALIIETVTGGNGVYEGSDDWWKGIELLCRENNIVLILDEVVCGFHRTGLPFGFMNYPVTPDIVCMAKAISGGIVPFGAIWTSGPLAQHYDEHILACGLTNYAHPLGIAALQGVLEIVSSLDFKRNLIELCHSFHSELEDFKQHPAVTAIRYKGMLGAIELKDDIKWQQLFNSGISLATQNKKLVLAPPLVMTKSILKEGMNRLKTAIGGIHA